ncbi:uncharacterized protein LOC130409250 [Triplophysa dalaica]|uniref:uncharacterized protein LOC130409250 n=1 Tax=Triplophysa dalaica TaxID=1582913 RepID=UPI0024DF9CE8|nr:uncharacterized protein LOC130409250 [Triplophysa dalaica]
MGIVPMVSTLDLQAFDERLYHLEDPIVPHSSEEEDGDACSNPRCQKLKEKIADLNRQVDTLTDTVREITQRYRRLQKRTSGAPRDAGRISRVTKSLLSSLGTKDRDKDLSAEPGESPPSQEIFEPTTSQQAMAGDKSLASQKDIAKSPPHFPDHATVLNEVLENLKAFQEGPDPTRKLKENVSGKIYRIKNFLAFMAAGKSNLSNLVFLNETARIHAWVISLRNSGVTETTIKHYVDNVAQFIDFIMETPPQSSRLSKNVMVGLKREMKGLRKSLKRGVAMHRTNVKAAKEERVISKALLLECRNKAKMCIPEALDLLETDPCPKNQWKFYGVFSAFLSSVFGHRGGVFQNLTIQELKDAKKSSTENAFLINIQTHKTNEVYGPAQIVLKEEEYQWAMQFLDVKDQLPGGKEAKFFFFVSTPNPCKNLNNYFQEAWKTMGLPGCPTFTDIRTSIASHAKFTHNPENRLKISKFMCHDVRTADKYYVTNLTAKQAVEHRRLFEAALEGPERSPASKGIPKPTTKRKRQVATNKGSRAKRKSEEPELTSGSTSPEEMRVTFQESGVSSLENSQGESEGAGSSDDGEAEKMNEATRDKTQGEESKQGRESIRRPVVLLTPMRSALKKNLSVSQLSPIKVKKTVLSRSLTLFGMGQQRQQRKAAKHCMDRWREKNKK